MALFRFFMIGSSQAPILEVDASTLSELSDDLARTRYLLARTVEIDGHPDDCEVLVPVSRIQMIMEPGH